MRAAAVKVAMWAISVCACNHAMASGDNAAEVKKIARCLVKNDLSLAYHYVTTLPQHETNRSRYKFGVVVSRCYRSPPTFMIDGYRMAYYISELLIDRDFGQPEISFSEVPPLESPQLSPGFASGLVSKKELEQRFQYYSAMSSFAECVVRASPVNAFEFVKSPAGSDAETQKIGELQESFGSCLSEGMVKLDREVVKGAMAHAYLRLATVMKRDAH